MLDGKKIVVVMPAYNAEKTLQQTFEDLPRKFVDEVILVDDQSSDATAKIARKLGLAVHVHPRNRGYGGNQKTCYRLALATGADIVVMIHPDYQYSPRLVPAMAMMISSGHYDLVLGSRILGGRALRSGMPVYKYIANRILTFIENLLLGARLSEYHTGLRAYSRELLEFLPVDMNSNDFVFDNEVIAQAHYFGFSLGEISCPTRYFDDASSIGLRRSCIYGFGVLRVALSYRLQKWNLMDARIFTPRRPS
ncbi:MAG: glycosyltransferase family 2 protein [Thermoanaerobaculales bacterium]